MLPYKTLINIQKNSKTPVYQQIVNQFISLIKQGILKSGQQILSSRQLSELLGIHRKTLVVALDELLTQGWLETKIGSGTFIATNLPEIEPKTFSKTNIVAKQKAGFDYEKKTFLYRELIKTTEKLHLDDGFPDPRLAPLVALTRSYRNQVLNGNQYIKLGYGDTKGALWLRQELANYLNESRAMTINAENIIIVRGTIMALYLATIALIKKGDNVVVGEKSWLSAKMNFQFNEANIITIPTDEQGIMVEALEEICKKQPIRLIYVTSHHDYPTTVTLKANRRIKLLNLAKKYRFIIFEDDYDYDFHYLSKPLLPLASADEVGVVLYAGSFTKSISPAFRVGYLVASEEIIEHLAHFRRIIDRQGDVILEHTIAELLHEGIIQKHLRKSLKIYRERRDFFVELLKEKLADEIDFQTPEGGMAIWAKFDKAINLEKTVQQALKQGLFFSAGQTTQVLNATRLGFASSNLQELEQCVKILKKSIIY